MSPRPIHIAPFLALAVSGCPNNPQRPVSEVDAGAPAASETASSARATPSATAASSTPAATASATPSSECLRRAAHTPEPTAPVAECAFVREVRCVPPSPVRSAWQPDFPDCPREIAPFRPSVYPAKGLFSGAETCAHVGQCCYVEFGTTACD